MPKDKRECHETEQCGGHGEPSEWLARLQRFVATERRKNRPQAKYPRQRSEPTETARLAEVQLLERHIGSWVPVSYTHLRAHET